MGVKVLYKVSEIMIQTNQPWDEWKHFKLHKKTNNIYIYIFFVQFEMFSFISRQLKVFIKLTIYNYNLTCTVI